MKKTWIYIIIIIVLSIILGFLWFKIINNSNNSNNNNQPGMNNSFNISYSATKKITKNEDISKEKYSSTKEDQNVLLASGNIKSTLSNLIQVFMVQILQY